MKNMFIKKKIYLDYAATRPIRKEVLKVMNNQFLEHGNPGSIHEPGKESKQVLKESRKAFLQYLGATSQDKIIFTSGGTESNNLAIKGILDQHSSGNILTTGFEHSSVIKIIDTYRDKNFSVINLPISKSGVIDLVESEKVIKNLDSCLFATCMMVQNEIGTAQPIKKLVKIIRKYHPEVVIHTDASQAPLYKKIQVQDLDVDLLTLCSHKIYGPVGISALYARDKITLSRQMIGGEQESGLRAGTEPVALIAGFTKAYSLCEDTRIEYVKRMNDLQSYFISSIESIKGCVLNGSEEQVLPLAINVSINNTQKSSEELVSFFNTHGIYLSSKSACMGAEVQSSYVLEACGLERENSIRFSFGEYTKKSDIDYVLSIIKKL